MKMPTLFRTSFISYDPRVDPNHATAIPEFSTHEGVRSSKGLFLGANVGGGSMVSAYLDFHGIF